MTLVSIVCIGIGIGIHAFKIWHGAAAGLALKAERKKEIEVERKKIACVFLWKLL